MAKAPSTAEAKKESLLCETFLAYRDSYSITTCLKSRGDDDAWPQASCRATFRGGASSAPHDDPCP